jgi:hypothetical protein
METLLPEFKIEGGNSTDGEIGFVAYIRAENEAEALRLFKDAVGFHEQTIKNLVAANDQVIEVCVYFNPDKYTVTKHVEQIDDGDGDEDDGNTPDEGDLS